MGLMEPGCKLEDFGRPVQPAATNRLRCRCPLDGVWAIFAWALVGVEARFLFGLCMALPCFLFVFCLCLLAIASYRRVKHIRKASTLCIYTLIGNPRFSIGSNFQEAPCLLGCMNENMRIIFHLDTDHLYTAVEKKGFRFWSIFSGVGRRKQSILRGAQRLIIS